MGQALAALLGGGGDAEAGEGRGSVLHVAAVGEAGWAAEAGRAARAACDTGVPLVVWLHGPEAAVEALGPLFDAVAAAAPRAEVVPLLQCAGHTLAAAARGCAYVAGEPPAACADAVAALQRLALPGKRGDGVPSGTAGAGLEAAGHEGAYADVAVGGTFDRLHAGHRALLATAALVCADGGRVWLGVASDQLLAKKANAHVLEPYATRAGAAMRYLAAVRPGVLVEEGPLTSASERPKASTMREMSALVVSRETVTGGEAIQGHRAEAGFPPLALVVVDLVGAASQAPDAAKLSSSALRAAEA